jgi:hypothetical protein
MDEKLRMIRKVSNRIVSALAVLLCIIIPGSFYTLYHGGVPTALAIFTVGVVGGVVGLQRRLKRMSDEDLMLLANSWVYVCLSPLTGGILAVVIYILFVSGMLKGGLFPEFAPVDDPTKSEIGLPVLFKVHPLAAGDYGKALLWGFIAGFSERFATDIISRFESNAASENKPGA